MATEILYPTGAGDYTNIPYQTPNSTYHWDKVDEASADDGTTYVSSDVATAPVTDVYALTDTAISEGSTITSVAVTIRVISNASYGPSRPILRLGTTDVTGTARYTSSWATYTETLARPGGGSWAVSDLNALQAGVSLSGDGESISGSCTQVYVTVTYTAQTNITITLTTVMTATSAETTPVSGVQANVASAMAATGDAVTPIGIISAVIASSMDGTGAFIAPVLDFISNPTITLTEAMVATGVFVVPDTIIQVIVTSLMVATGDMLSPSILKLLVILGVLSTGLKIQSELTTGLKVKSSLSSGLNIISNLED